MALQGRTAARNGTIDDMRDQEVVRATNELAAYFKGQRTEREARAALKIIRAYVKERERLDPAKRRPLPGFEPPPAPIERKKKDRDAGKKVRAKAKRRRHARESAPPEPSPALEPVADQGAGEL